MSNGLKSRYIVFQEYNLDFTHKKVERFKEMWRVGYSTSDIADELRYETVEIDLLAVDLLLKEKIKQRPGFLNGILEVQDDKIRIEV